MFIYLSKLRVVANFRERAKYTYNTRLKERAEGGERQKLVFFSRPVPSGSRLGTKLTYAILIQVFLFRDSWQTCSVEKGKC